MPGGARPENGNWVIPNELGNEMGNRGVSESTTTRKAPGLFGKNQPPIETPLANRLKNL